MNKWEYGEASLIGAHDLAIIGDLQPAGYVTLLHVFGHQHDVHVDPRDVRKADIVEENSAGGGSW